MPARAADMFVGIGGNLHSPRFGPPEAVMAAALGALSAAGLVVRRRSRWYRSAPVPPSPQPSFINGVVHVCTMLPPDNVLASLHAIEAGFGRVRGERNAARILDLDLLACGRLVLDRPGGVQVPHPRLHLRTFVLLPLIELAPDWRHPCLNRTPVQLLADMPAEVAAGQCAEVIPEDRPEPDERGG